MAHEAWKHAECIEKLSCLIDFRQEIILNMSEYLLRTRLSAMVCNSTILESIVRKSSMPQGFLACKKSLIGACSPLLVELLLDDGLSLVLAKGGPRS